MANALPYDDLPPGCAPLGSLQAYETAYKERYKPGDHIGAHLAGLRAVVLLDRQRRTITPSPRGEDAAPDPSLTSNTEQKP